MEIFRREARIENYMELCSWIRETREKWNINKEIANKLDICVEEIFANISNYAYSENIGIIEVEFKKTDDSIILEFKDEGKEFNPLMKPDPNLHLPPEKKALGGLGIYLTKQMSDSMVYKRENDKNILTLTFKI